MPSRAISGVRGESALAAGLGRAADAPAVERDPALRRAPQAHDRAQRRRLAGAVAAEQHRHLARRHLEVDAVQDVVRADVRVHAGEQSSSGVCAHARPAAAPAPGRDRLAARSARRSPPPARRRRRACRCAARRSGRRARAPRPSCARPGARSCRPRPSGRGSGRGSPARRRRSCRRSARRTCRRSARGRSASPPRACAGRRAAGCWRRHRRGRRAPPAAPARAPARACRWWSSQTDQRSRPCLRRDCTARRTFSSTERLGKSWVSWNARPRPRWVRCDTGSFVMSVPFSRTVPALARSWPEIRLK